MKSRQARKLLTAWAGERAAYRKPTIQRALQLFQRAIRTGYNPHASRHCWRWAYQLRAMSKEAGIRPGIRGRREALIAIGEWKRGERARVLVRPRQRGRYVGQLACFAGGP